MCDTEMQAEMLRDGLSLQALIPLRSHCDSQSFSGIGMQFLSSVCLEKTQFC